jgi:hypothetical protein
MGVVPPGGLCLFEAVYSIRIMAKDQDQTDESAHKHVKPAEILGLRLFLFDTLNMVRYR